MGPPEGEEEEFVTHHCMMITYISCIHIQLKVVIIVILVKGAHHRTVTWTFISSVKNNLKSAIRISNRISRVIFLLLLVMFNL